MGQVALAPDIDEEIPRSYFRFGCRAFEAELYKFLENSKPGVLNDIREKKVLDDAVTAELTDAIKETKANFKGRKA